jgi:nucleotide-binding universal stress UspA family protein
MKVVLAGIDGSTYTRSVCDHASWAAKRLGAPLHFLHVLTRDPLPATPEWSGNMAPGERQSLLAAFTKIDEVSSRAGHRRGRALLDDAVREAGNQGVRSVNSRLARGSLAESLKKAGGKAAAGSLMIVLGKQGDRAHPARLQLGSELERAVRAIRQPLLIASHEFRSVGRVLIVFDGSEAGRKSIETVAASALLRGLACHLLTAADDAQDSLAALRWSADTLSAADFIAGGNFHPRNAEQDINDYIERHAIDLLLIGASGRFRLRRFLNGCDFAASIRTCPIPVMLLR